MPLRNRVTPFGEIIATEARGTLFGNRGVLHDPDGALRRDWQVRRWIACRLEFKGRHRELLQPNRYTELFLLDEATALAAGHRPCAECRREDYVRFRDAWAHANPGQGSSADAMDRLMHAERVPVGPGRPTFDRTFGNVPDGVMVAEGDRAMLVVEGGLRAWSPSGYGPATHVAAATRVRVLTPPSIVRVIEAGYQPALHPTAR